MSDSTAETVNTVNKEETKDELVNNVVAKPTHCSRSNNFLYRHKWHLLVILLILLIIYLVYYGCPTPTLSETISDTILKAKEMNLPSSGANTNVPAVPGFTTQKGGCLWA